MNNELIGFYVYRNALLGVRNQSQDKSYFEICHECALRMNRNSCMTWSAMYASDIHKCIHVRIKYSLPNNNYVTFHDITVSLFISSYLRLTNNLIEI